MTNDKDNKTQPDKDSALSPDEKTMHTPDPQEKMEGPVSSATRSIGESFDSQESQDEADKKRDKNM